MWHFVLNLKLLIMKHFWWINKKIIFYLQRAFRYLQQAADAGNSNAMAYLGKVYSQAVNISYCDLNVHDVITSSLFLCTYDTLSMKIKEASRQIFTGIWYTIYCTVIR